MTGLFDAIYREMKESPAYPIDLGPSMNGLTCLVTEDEYLN